ncbi:MAG: hypothetical protein JJE07_08720 [Flavobacteriaceae bacterium]|nr:hypothetical protein [Flavobacteriaceae bacterium]
MEFFRIIDKKVTQELIKDSVQPKSIENFTETMLFIENHEENFLGSTLWGEFKISYDKINGGVRFTLLDCPNALSWTITTGLSEERKRIILHCTINQSNKPDEFIEEIQEFLDEWETGIKAFF